MSGLGWPREAPAQTPEQALGARLRAHRQARRLTLRQVARTARVSESFVSQVERGTSGVSVSTLHTIAAALGLTVADLFDRSLAVGPKVVPAAERPMIAVPGVQKYMLTRAPLQGLEVLECEYEPSASTGGSEHCHGDSQELLLVLEGSILLTVGDLAYQMTAGDSIEYRSSAPHGVHNDGGGAARVLFVISPPSL